MKTKELRVKLSRLQSRAYRLTDAISDLVSDLDRELSANTKKTKGEDKDGS